MGRTSKDIIDEQLDGIGAAIKICIKNLINEGLYPTEACEFVSEYLQDFDCEAEGTAVPGEEE